MSQESRRSSHVREPNFARSILTLGTVQQFQGQRGGALVIGAGVANIPCTAKNDIVRKWIETHAGNVFHPSGDDDGDDEPCPSPVLGVPATRRAQTSPVFGNRRKRPREKRSFRTAAAECSGHGCSSVSDETIGEQTFRSCSHRRSGVKRCLFDSPSAAPPLEPASSPTSPVLLKKSRSSGRGKRKPDKENAPKDSGSPVLDSSFSRGRKRSSRRRGSSANPLGDAKNTYLDSSRNSVPPWVNTPSPVWNIVCSQKRRLLLRRLEDSFEDDSKISEESTAPRSPVSKAKSIIEDDAADTAKDAVKSEIEFSNDENDPDQRLSDNIEDVDTQDLVPPFAVGDRFLPAATASIASKSVSQISTQDSDRTFCLEAEKLVDPLPATRSSQRISQVSSKTGTDGTEIGSSRTGNIASTESSPPKKCPDPSIQLTLIDSAKKRRKPKRGSLVEKLQSVVNRQVSFARIWKHQLKRSTRDEISVPGVTVHVRACTVRYGRQFLEGIAIEDPLDLLGRGKPGGKSVKLVKIMTVPDIVGRIEMKTDGLVQIFPPWEVLDEEESVLNVTYIRVALDDARRCDPSVNRIARPIVVNFSCPCIEANRIVSSCKDRSGKPDAIGKISSGS